MKMMVRFWICLILIWALMLGIIAGAEAVGYGFQIGHSDGRVTRLIRCCVRTLQGYKSVGPSAPWVLVGPNNEIILEEEGD